MKRIERMAQEDKENKSINCFEKIYTDTNEY